MEVTVDAISHMDVAHVAFSSIYFQKHKNGIASIRLTYENVSSLQNNLTKHVSFSAVNLENFSSLFKQYADIFTVGKIKVPA